MALIDKQHGELEEKVVDLRRRIEVVEVAQDQEDQMRAFCEVAVIGIDLFTFDDKRAVIELLDIKGYYQLCDNPDDDVISLSGYIPTLEIGLSANGDTFGYTRLKSCVPKSAIPFSLVVHLQRHYVSLRATE
jgi:hypothetical protein